MNFKRIFGFQLHRKRTFGEKYYCIAETVRRHFVHTFSSSSFLSHKQVEPVKLISPQWAVVMKKLFVERCRIKAEEIVSAVKWKHVPTMFRESGNHVPEKKFQ